MGKKRNRRKGKGSEVWHKFLPCLKFVMSRL